MTSKGLKKIFKKFAGREVAMKGEEKSVYLPQLGFSQPYSTLALANKSDPVLREIEAEAHKHGLSLRVDWQGGSTTTALGFRANRAIATIEKAPNGKYRISKNFTLG